MKILTVYGTRPEAIKLNPIFVEAESRPGVEITKWFTCQADEQYIPVKGDFIAHRFSKSNSFKLRSYGEIVTDLTTFIEHPDVQPDYIMVQGDTFSTLAGSQVGYFNQIPVIHIEAGLRTYEDNPFPEEKIRNQVDDLSSIRFCPTVDSWYNLEGETDYIVGNTVIDALFAEKPFSKEYLPLGYGGQAPYFVCSLHRRESWDSFGSIIESFSHVCEKMREHIFCFIWHPNRKASSYIASLESTRFNVRVIRPQSYQKAVNLMNYSSGVMTDSGGMIEEAAALGKPCFILRDQTERYEAVKANKAKLIGRGHKIRNIPNYFRWLEDWFNPNDGCPFGDGKASGRILNALEGKSFDLFI